ncbi:MAG TPA: efflux RND transporter periplasmic adaptor subunit [Flavobacteriales bacterium]|nr:efflux RND transporter periplasmic adaptor subunit [Flavobacteriales bacterium]
MNQNILKQINRKNSLIIVAVLILGMVLGKFLGSSSGYVDQPQLTDSHNHTKNHKEDTTIWTCSMHPQIQKEAPGQCPICGMDLIPMTTTDQTDQTDPNEIPMTESAMKLAEVQTYTVKAGAPEKSLYLFGKVKPDERHVSVLTARFGGRLEKLYVNFVGQFVRKGQKLASIYSPELNTAQQELLDAAKYKNENPSFYKAARNKLKLWDLTDAQIDAIEKKDQPGFYFDVLSPITGTVTHKDVAIGDYVKKGMSLFEVVNLNRVWVMFEAYESDLPWINNGGQILFTTQAIPGKQFKGNISYIAPFINPTTRVAQVRVEMSNPNLQFKPEMFVNGILQAKITKQNNQILIPKTAVLWTGKRAVVYVKVANRQQPTFVYREISLGPEAGNFYVVTKGLKTGEKIASNGVFKIDASAQLLGKQSMMNPKGDIAKTGKIAGMDM